MKRLNMLRVMESISLTKDIYSLKLYSPKLCDEALPGRFFHVKCGGDKFPLLRRPLSISYRLKKEGAIVLIYRILGQGTKFLSARKKGDWLNILGPLGNGFEIRKEYKNVAVIGGGIGIAPLMGLLDIYGDNATMFAGFEGETFLLKELGEKTSNMEVATCDGSIGYKGLVTDLLTGYLKEQKPDTVFACGPKPMLKKVALLCRDSSVPCQVSLEQRMACGVGACSGCSCATVGEDEKREYSNVCTDGPVFWGEEVCWDE